MSSDPKKPSQSITGLVGRLVESYHADKRTSHLDAAFLPNRDRTIQVIELLRRLIFPGYFDDKRLTSKTIHAHTTDLLGQTRAILYEQVREALRYVDNNHIPASGNAPGSGDAAAPAKNPQSNDCDQEADRITDAFLDRLPELRRILATDIQAGYDGDPAAAGTDEIIFCYPGVDAIFTYRIAHELHGLKVPLLPRMMTEYAHNETGIDIHPGASIDESFFIDHGTGVVIGETTVIGKRVKIYQGVTLGALSTKAVDALRGRKRHPTIEDEVTIYAGSTILGGQTVIGAGATINGGVFVTRSVPAGHTVSTEPPVLHMKDKRRRKMEEGEPLDFQV